jgi:2-polyprenyl-3-methyl-5-hydroxy-6-metoxy-1,4-benzoquinol methylase
MDDPVQARAYSETDFSEPHQAFVDAFVVRFPELTNRAINVVDLGCGPADVTVRFARAHPRAHVVGIDAAEAMLTLARDRVAAAGLDGRVSVEQRHLPDEGLADTGYDVVISNSLLHHLDDPLGLWHTVKSCTAPEADVFVMDLCRPADDAMLDALVAEHAGDAPPILQRDFRASLMAAYRPGEVRAQIADAGLALRVDRTTDRHVIAWGSLTSRSSIGTVEP